MTVQEIVKRVTDNSPLYTQAGIQVSQKEIDLKKAKAYRTLPEAELKIRSGLVPDARGDVFNSPDDDDTLDALGPYVKMNLKIIQPLYTFGKIKKGIAAADAAVLSETQKRELVKQKLGETAVLAFHNLYAARRGIEVANDFDTSYRELLKEVNKRLKDDNTTVGYADLYEVESADYRITQSVLAINNKAALAEKVLKILLDEKTNIPFELQQTSIPVYKDDNTLLSPQNWQEKHPELKTVNSILQGLEARMGFSRTENKPILYLGGGYSYAETGGRDDQSNPFVNDDWNYNRLGAEVGLKWEFGISRHQLAWEKSKLEYELALEKKRQLEDEIEINLQDTLQQVGMKFTLMTKAKKSLQAAKSWLRVAHENFDLGIGDVGPLLDAYERFYKLRAIEITEERDYHAALAHLSYHLGDIEFYLNWIEHGRVQIR